MPRTRTGTTATDADDTAGRQARDLRPEIKGDNGTR